ncbi:BnaA09g16410D [Brassica napus]|uniref:BnaA09g16410D protein n=1 Tax=Brassica napus TaxID=3708 RepID=A0A078H685_BRANA|nr:BnaA09g16410D [Brassica napus]
MSKLNGRFLDIYQLTRTVSYSFKIFKWFDTPRFGPCKKIDYLLERVSEISEDRLWPLSAPSVASLSPLF